MDQCITSENIYISKKQSLLEFYVGFRVTNREEMFWGVRDISKW